MSKGEYSYLYKEESGHHINQTKARPKCSKGLAHCPAPGDHFVINWAPESLGGPTPPALVSPAHTDPLLFTLSHKAEQK